MPKANPFIKPTPEPITESGQPTDAILNQPLVNENDKEKIDGDPALIIDSLRAELQELEEKHHRVIEKKDAAEKDRTRLKAELEDSNRRAATHAIKAQRMRVFCELINGMAARGVFQPYHATDNPKGIKSEAEVDKIINHAAGIAERSARIVDERFAK